MAYPIIRSSTYGTNESVSTDIHVISMPSTIVEDDYIIGFIGTEQGSYNHIESSSGNFTIWGSTDSTDDYISLVCFSGRALGSGLDNLTLHYNTSSIVTFIVYSIQNHGMYTSSEISYNYINRYATELFQVPSLYCGSTGDYLLLSVVVHSQDCTTLGMPSGYTSIIYDPETVQNTGNDAASIGCANDNYTGTGPGATTFNNDPLHINDYITIITRIKPGPLPIVGSEGFGIYTVNYKIAGTI